MTEHDDPNTLELLAPDGTPLPLYWYPAAQPAWRLLLLPALGIQARLYRRLAAGLAANGCSTAILEQRGHGLSPLRASYRQRHSMLDLLEQDLPAALDWLDRQDPASPLLLGGHSLGGHLSTLYVGQHPDRVAGVIHLACAFPFIDAYTGRQQSMLRLLCRLIPVFRLVPGYYPGTLLGFGERESSRMMQEWRHWAVTGRFEIAGYPGTGADVGRFMGPVLSLGFDRDHFSTEAAVKHALAPFTHARITQRTLGRTEQGDHLGHTGWARAPSGVVDAVVAWLTEAVPINPGTETPSGSA